MPDSTAASPELTAPPLTEVQRVVDTFTAPSKTFTDILRKATFWGPLLIMILVSVGFSFARPAEDRMGQGLTNNMLHQSPKGEERFAQMPPDQAANAKAVAAKITGIVTYIYTVIVLIITAITTLLVWVTVNFGFAGTSKYSQVYAVNMYASSGDEHQISAGYHRYVCRPRAGFVPHPEPRRNQRRILSQHRRA